MRLAEVPCQLMSVPPEFTYPSTSDSWCARRTYLFDQVCEQLYRQVHWGQSKDFVLQHFDNAQVTKMRLGSTWNFIHTLHIDRFQVFPYREKYSFLSKSFRGLIQSVCLLHRTQLSNRQALYLGLVFLPMAYWISLKQRKMSECIYHSYFSDSVQLLLRTKRLQLMPRGPWRL